GNFTGGADLEWCERRLLARIHSLTLGKLRKAIEPVTAAQFMRWLLEWQHASPGTQLAGERGTFEAVRQLQGFEAPACVWESQILPRRIAHYDPAVLDQLCLNGTVGWGRLSPHPGTVEGSEGSRRVTPSRAAPITFFVREDAAWMIPRRAESSSVIEGNLSPGARDVLGFLRQRGASFFPDIVRATARLKAEVETALWELVAAGLITADGFDNLRALIDPKRRAGQGRGRDLRPRHSTGRWALLFPGESQDRTQAVEPACRMLLHRYGIVFREILARETLQLTWRELLIGFRRLEDQGEVRGGRFVDGFVGEQFALPVAVESLRATRRQAATGQMVTVSAADPLNLVGVLTPGERITSSSSRFATFRDGVPVAPITPLPSILGAPELQAG
ncbi:MAG TPA: DEAD/DEAH box helicase, partial [Terriglobia bacterium]|nr:DEAD/DEAH box helicase [Terriglobia bacterium]